MRITKKKLRIILSISVLVLVVFSFVALLTRSGKPVSAAVASDANSTNPCVGAPAPTQWKHVIVVMFENKTYNNVIGNSNVPYINSLVSNCGTSTGGTADYRSAEKFNADGTAATWSCGDCNSKQNYATLTSGKTPAALGITTDLYPTLAPAGTENIYSRLYAAGKTAKSYYAGAASTTPCASSNFSGAYHDAIRYYPNLGGQSSSPSTLCNLNDKALGTVWDTTGSAANYSNFMNDVNNGNLPSFSLILPTNVQNMHDLGVVTSQDNWLKGFLNPIFDSAQYKSGDTAVFFLFDEDTPMPNALIAPSVVKGSKVPAPSGNNISHYSMLRTWQEMLGVKDADGTFLGDSDAAPSLLSFFNGGGTPPPPIDNPPAVNITSPTSGATIGTGTVAITANATDDKGVAKVEFYDNGTLIGTSSTSPYGVSWNTSALSGSHSLTAKAYDTSNQTTTSSAINVTVSIPPSCPNDISTNPSTAVKTISVAQPGTYTMWVRMRSYDTTNNSAYMQVDSACAVNVGDSAAMPANQWVWVNYKDGNASTLNITASLAVGQHTITMAKRENNVDIDRIILLADNCQPTNLGLNCTDSTAPSVSVTSPTGGSTVSGQVAISATASDTETGISKVDFLIDNNVTSSVSTGTSPYNYNWNSTSVPDGVHTIAARATDGAGNINSSPSVSITVKNQDTTPPSIPTNLSSTAIQYNQVGLQWGASTDNVGVAGYRVLRSGSVVGTVTTGTTFTDSTVAPNTSYNYTVVAFDTAGNQSAPSNVVNAVTPEPPDNSPPTTPTGLTTTNVAYNKVDLKWNASTDNVGVIGYFVARDGVVIASTTTTSYSDTTVSPKTSYKYTVYALDAASNPSASSNEVAVITPDKPDTIAPSVPTNLIGDVISGPQVNLVWAQSTDNVGVSGYEIWRDGTKIGTSPATSFGDATVVEGQTFTYSVLAYDAVGNKSAQSTSISVAIPKTAHPETLVFAPSDDATVNSRYPNRTLGLRNDLYTSSNRNFYMKFNVQGINGRTVTSAQLQLLQVNKSNIANTGVKIFPVSNNSWSESTITWNNAPTAGNTAIGLLANGKQNNWTTAAVNGYITQDGIYSMKFQIADPKYTSGFASKSSANKPQLILTVE